MNKNTLILLIGGLIIVGGIGFWYASSMNANPGTTPPPVAPTPTPATPPPSTTHLPVPPNTKVPEPGEKPADTTVAVPVSVTPAAPGVEAKIRSYNITANANVFDPSTVIANVGDTIHINFTAVDKTYDITVPDYGLKQTAKKGETKVLEFQAVAEGKYLYYCELCGGTATAPGSASGYMIISKK